jgi:hypothetical protein
MAERPEVLDVWRDVCDRLARLGEEVCAEPFPTDRDDQVDGLAHVAQQALCWVGWSVFHADPRRPFFHRNNDHITQWGGPNADNVYRHARIDPARRYRVRGRMNGCEEFVLAIRRGFMHQPKWGTVHEVYASQLGIGRGDEFELVLGGDQGPERWVPLPDDAIMATFREYYFDWDEAEPAFLTIECLDDDVDAPAPRLTGPELTARLEDAVAGIEHSVRNWNSYLDEHRAQGVDNVMAPLHGVAKGLAAARYGFCFWDLDDDAALVFETTVPDARYWSFQLYEMGTYEAVDIVERQSSLNHRQVAVDDDGRVRVVVSHRDPGVANWLDAGGRRVGLFTFRAFWGQADPEYTTRLVTVDDVPSALPPGTARVDEAARRATMAARRRHLAWRYRT